MELAQNVLIANMAEAHPLRSRTATARVSKHRCSYWFGKQRAHAVIADNVVNAISHAVSILDACISYAAQHMPYIQGKTAGKEPSI